METNEAAKPERKFSVLVLGGTGAMGVSLVEILANKGMQVHVTSRRSRLSDKPNVKYIRGNAKDLAFLEEVLQTRYDAVVDFMSYSTAEFSQRYNLLLSSTDQYIFISSARVYAESPKPLTEESPRLLEVCADEEYIKTDEYALSKARQEDLLMKSGKLNYTIVRPSLTYNDYRLQLVISEKEEWLYRAVKGRSIVLPSDIMGVKTSMAWGGDVAKAIALLVMNAKAFGQTIQIASEQAMTWADTLEVYQQVLERRLGWRASVHYVPNALQLAQRLHRLYQIKYARAINRTFDCSKLKSIVGDEVSFLSPAEGLAQCLNAFLNKRRFSPIPTNSHALFDRMTGERTKLSEFPNAKGKLKYLLFRYTGIEPPKLPF